MAVDGVTLVDSIILINGSTPSIGDGDKGLFIGSEGRYDIDLGVDKLTVASKLTIFQDKQIFNFDNTWTGNIIFSSNTVEHINVIWFGAVPDNPNVDSSIAIQKAIDSALNSRGTSVVYFPPGVYYIAKPIVVVYRGSNGTSTPTFFNLTLKGNQQPFNDYSKGGISALRVKPPEEPEDPVLEMPFFIGIHNARGVTIDSLVFHGNLAEIMPPVGIDGNGDPIPFNKFNESDLIYLPTDELYPISRKKQFAPICAIVIDPFHSSVPYDAVDEENEQYLGLKSYYDLIPIDSITGSSKIVIKNCAIEDFPNGIVFSPNGGTEVEFDGETKPRGTLQGDSISVKNCRITNVINGIVTCQGEARRLVVINCDFSRMKYGFNGDEYGYKIGVVPEVSNLKFSGGSAWLYRFTGATSYGHFSHVYCEGLYGIGYCASNFEPLSFVNCVFKFRPRTDAIKGYLNPCILFGNNASMVGCTLTVGGGSSIAEPLIIAVNTMTYLNCYLDTIPVNIGLYVEIVPPNSHNISTDINSNIKKSKISGTTWSEATMVSKTNTVVNFDTVLQMFYFETENIYIKEKDFVFGFAKFNEDPFDAPALAGLPFNKNPPPFQKFFTCYGIVKEVEPVVGPTIPTFKVFFENNILNKNTTPYPLKIIDKN